MGIQGVVLEDHRDIAIPCRHLIDTLAIDTEVALGDVLETGNHSESGTFAAARWANQYHKLTVFNDQIDIFDGSNAAVIDHEEQRARDHGHDGQRHQEMHVLKSTKLGAECIQRYREGRLILRMQIDQGQHEVVPGEDKGKHCGDGRHGPGQRHDDPPPRLKPSASVKSGGFEQRFWQLRDELAVHKDVKCTAKERRNNERQQRVDPAQTPEENEKWNHRDLSRKHHCGEHEQEGRLTATETNSGKGRAHQT